MKLELSPSFTDDDQNNLNILLEAFGSAVSLEDIASSYCQTGRNLDSTAELLCNMQGSSISDKQDHQNTDEEASSESSSAILSEKISIVKPSSKKCSASIGTVSNVIGRGYMNPRNQPKRVIEKSKPMKINSDEFPVTEIWGEEKEPEITAKGEPMDNDLVEFLYRMLGNGFELGTDVIQEVIGQCGYDMPMIIEKLVDMSAATLGKTDAVIGTTAATDMKNIYDVGSTSCPKQSQPLHCTGSGASGGDELILPRAEMKKKDKQREVLEALFSAPDRNQDHQVSTRPVRICRQTPYGRIVAKPLKEMIIEDFTFINRKPINDTDTEAYEKSYDELRKAVNENFVTMREYYKASGDAYSKNDFKAAQSLLEQGNFYMEKAKEAHEQSCQKLVADSNEDEDFHINVHYLEPKDALHHMRLHLKSLCAVRFMKVVVGISGDKTDGRRKRLITKLLEKEGIPWTEEGNGWIISVQVEEIDQNKLSFANK